MTDAVVAHRTPAATRPTPTTHVGAPAFRGTVAEGLILVCAPSTGRFRPTAVAGEVEAGALLGHITGQRGRADAVAVPAGGALAGLLARPGQLVSKGQALAWLQAAPAVLPA